MIKLNEKEKEIIRLLSEGKGRGEISKTVCASKRVVSYIIESICIRAEIPVKSAALVGWYYKNAQKYGEGERV